MNINKKYIILGIIVLTAVWAGNIFYYQNHMLKEPLFTKHYYNINDAGLCFQLYCIDNINSQNKVTGIVFPEIGPEFVTFDERSHNNDNRYYKLNIINVRLSDNPETFDRYENKIITKAEVHLSDGKVMNVDIGKILIDNNSVETVNELLQFESAMGSSNNTGQAIYKANTDLKIESIFFRFPELIGNILKVNVNEKPLEKTSFPIELKKGDSLNIKYSYNFDDDNLSRSYSYFFPLYIMSEDNEGNKGRSITFTQYWLQFPDLYDIDALKMDRGIQ